MVVREPWQQVIVFNSFFHIISFCCALSQYMELNYAAIPTGVRRCDGLSFKSGYHQTG